MPFTLFHERFPKIAEKETRTITIFNFSELPNDSYGLVEAYCDELDCDCRRVFLNVISANHKKLLATIAFGWESKEYYARWMGNNDPRAIKDLKGPVLNSASSQSKLAPALLNQIKVVLEDKNYIKRLKRHYNLFKDEIKKEEKKMQKQVGITNSSYTVLSARPKVGRNDPCPCGSGKKYKKCCLNSVSPPSQEHDELDLLMRRGQLLLEKNETAKACDVWLELWANLKIRFKPEFRDIQEAESIFSGCDYIFNWCQDLEAELGNAGNGNLQYYQKRLEYCSEFCSLFPESSDNLMENMKRAIAESYFALGDIVKGDECFEELIEQYPESIWGYVGWGDMYSIPFNKEMKPDYDRAEQIYKMGLDKEIKEEAILIDRLDDLKKEKKADSS